MHAHYRSKFSTVDVWNRHTFGPTSLQHAYRTKSWQMRFFFAMIAACVTNAFLAGNYHLKRQGGVNFPTLRDFKLQLVTELIENPWSAPTERRVVRTPKKHDEVAADDLPIDRIAANTLGHGALTANVKSGNRQCSVCKARRTQFQCTCGAYVCTPTYNVSHCLITHCLKCIPARTWIQARVDCGFE